MVVAAESSRVKQEPEQNKWRGLRYYYLHGFYTIYLIFETLIKMNFYNFAKGCKKYR